VTFAGGLAAAGKRPFVAIYSSFLQRAYDNIIHDVAIQGLPVTFCIDRAGIVGEDGVTHHGLFDMSYLRCIPGMSIASPMDEATLRNLMYSSLKWSSPLAIRYPRGKSINAEWHTKMEQLEKGKGRCIYHTDGAKIAVLTIGPVGNDAIDVCRNHLEKDIAIDIYDMIWLKPLDTVLIDKITEMYSEIVTIEDGAICGGLASAVLEYLNLKRQNIHVTALGVPDKWIHHGTVNQLRALCGYDKDSIEGILRTLQHNLKAK
jgi:1-deoxy-D-xylulose-5-phosphate synthase